ncbi:MAG: PAS domain S-box protein, partial [Gallionella sp.]|nr:PAS domain S-box protein [Gallionella sp.]
LREIFNIVNADTREPADNPVDAVLREGHTVGLATHTMLLSRSGQEYAIEDSAAPLRDANGKLGGVVLVFHDDTRQREVQHRLQESEERLRMTLTYAADALFISERDGRFVFVNDNMTSLLGYSSAELVQMTAFDLVPDDWRATYRQRSEQMLVDNQNYLFEIRWLKKDGSKIPMELNAVLLPNGRIYGSCRDISERKNNQRQTEAMVRRHQVLMKSTFDGIHILDIQGNIVEANDAFCKMLGYTHEEVARMNVADWDAQWSREVLLERLNKLVHEPGMMFETRHRCKDGSVIDVEICSAGVEIAGQHYLFASSRDITARKQSEALRQQKMEELEAIYLLSEAVSRADTLELVYEEAMDYMQRLMGIARVSIMLFDAQGVMRFKAWRGLSDAYRAAVDGHTPWDRDVVDPRPFCVDNFAPDTPFANLAKIITDEGIKALCFIPLVQHGRLLGKLTLYFDQKAPLAGSDVQLASTIASHVAFAIDRKLVEQQFVDMFEFSPDAIIMTDSQAVITRINQQAEMLFGYASGELVGQTIDILIPQDRPDADRLSMRRRFLASAMRPRPLGATGRKDLRAISKSGRIFPVEISLAPMNGTHGRLIAAAVRDVSGRQQVIQQLISTAAELEQANVQIEEERAMLAQRVLERTAQLMLANKAKDSFLATMSHEIRTPLGGLLGMIELLGLSPLNRAQSEMLHVAQNSGKSLLRIVDDILDWSKIEAGKLELAPVVASIAETIKGVIGTYAQLASTKGITLRQQVDDNLSAAHLFDPLRVSQILNNFTSNALKFTAHGSVEIGAECLSRQNGSETVRFRVTDSGVGITPEQQSRLFQHYEQASNDTARMYGGTGLGLAICRSLAELMEGTLSVQ